MKPYYIVEYIRNGKNCADIFPTQQAAFKLTRDKSIIWQRVLKQDKNGRESVIVENPSTPL